MVQPVGGVVHGTQGTALGARVAAGDGVVGVTADGDDPFRLDRHQQAAHGEALAAVAVLDHGPSMRRIDETLVESRPEVLTFRPTRE